MKTELQQALSPVVSFKITNSDSSNAKKLCLLPGHYDTQEIVMTVDPITSTKDIANLSYASPSHLVDAGYFCDQVADDTAAAVKTAKEYGLTVTPGSPRCHYRDFLNYIQREGSRITKIRITNNRTGGAGRDQFDKEFEVSSSMLGAKAGSDYINLASCKNPANYDQDMIIVDLQERNLIFDATTLLFLTVVPSADFTIEYTLDK